MGREDIAFAEEILAEDCEGENAHLNPKCDLGHSYSFVRRDQKNEKLLANLVLVTPKIAHLTEKYRDLLNSSASLATEMKVLNRIFNDAVESKDEVCQTIVKKPQIVFEPLLLALNNIVTNSSLKAEQVKKLNSLKQDIEELKIKCIEVF